MLYGFGHVPSWPGEPTGFAAAVPESIAVVDARTDATTKTDILLLKVCSLSPEGRSEYHLVSTPLSRRYCNTPGCHSSIGQMYYSPPCTHQGNSLLAVMAVSALGSILLEANIDAGIICAHSSGVSSCKKTDTLEERVVICVPGEGA